MRTILTITALLLTMLVSGLTSATPAARPQRIVSMNLCTDQLLILLADPANIVSVSYLSLEEHSSFVAPQVRAAGYIVNHSLPEEVLPLDPDLIVTGQFMHQQETRLLRQLGKQVETFPVINSLADARQNIHRMAELIGEPARGRQLIDEMDRRLALLTARSPVHKLPAVTWHPHGFTQGRNTLMDELMTLAGWHNIARDFGIEGYRQLQLEELLAGQPQLLILSEYAPGTRSIGQSQLRHPVLKKLLRDSSSLVLDSRLLICGGPMNLVALEALVEARNER